MGADVVATRQTLGNTPDCTGFWDPSSDMCTYEVYAECPFSRYELGATVRVYTTIKWDKHWTHGIAQQAYEVWSIGQSRLCKGQQNIDLVTK